MKTRLEILNKVANGELTPIEAEKQLLVLSDAIPRSYEYWNGFDYACSWLDELFAKSHPHKYNIADCLKAKVNRLPKSKIRPNLAQHRNRRNNKQTCCACLMLADVVHTGFGHVCKRKNKSRLDYLEYNDCTT